MQNKHERLQKRVKKLEEKLRIIVGDSVWKWFATRRSHVEVEKIIGLLNQRKGLLDKMFVATPEEIVRMEKVNNRLLELTNILFVRTEELCHKTMINNYAKNDNFIYICWIRHSIIYEDDKIYKNKKYSIYSVNRYDARENSRINNDILCL